MKYFFYLILPVLIFSFASCNDEDDNNYINQNELPAEAIDFLNKYLPNNAFVSAKRDKKAGEEQYIYWVNLKEDIFVSFGTAGNWCYAQSEKGLPETIKPLLSENSQKELKEKYPNTKMTTLSDHGNGLLILLNNNKTFYDINSHEGYVLAEKINAEDIHTIPEKMKAFINEYFNANIRSTNAPKVEILKFIGFRGAIYRLVVTNQAIVDFYENGDWFYMQNTGTQKVVQNVFIRAISEDMVKVLGEKYPNASSSLLAITRFNNNELYGFDLGNNNFVVINSANQIIEPPLDKAKEYIKKGFNPEKELLYEVSSNTSTPYFLRYAFIITGEGTISLVTDIEGNMRIVSAGPITNGTGAVPLPRAVLEMLPNAIMSYFDAHYPKGEVLHISHSYSVKQDDIPEEISLTMPIPNNLKILTFDSSTGQFISEYNVIGER